MAGRFRFDRFVLDAGERQLSRDEVPVELNTRFLDALVLLVREAGRLVSKDRFLAEVWRGVPVADEALTQCIKALRRQFGDDAARPRFIETVPKHGYRFIASIEDGQTGALTVTATPPPSSDEAEPPYTWRRFLLLGGAGTIGAAIAGVIGGLFYGFASASQSLGAGAASVVLVVLWLTLAAALTGGAGVSFGIAAAGFAQARSWSIVGGAAGGMIIAGAVKLLGLDAFNLLLGRSPGDITGAGEGLLPGGAVGLSAWLADRNPASRSLRQSLGVAALVGGPAVFSSPRWEGG